MPGPPVTPYRPTVANRAQLPYPGQVELELGGLASKFDAGGRRQSLPYALKLAFSSQWGIVLSGEAAVSLSGAPGQARAAWVTPT